MRIPALALDRVAPSMAALALLAACAPAAAVDTAATAQAAAGAACWTEAAPEELEGRPSPLDSASVALEAGTVKLCYGSPRMRDREIMGGLVPFDEPWRLGANEATTIHVPTSATIAGVAVEPGWYSLYTIPGAEEWEIVVNGTAQRWGIPINEEVTAQDIGSGTVAVVSTSAPIEELTIQLEQVSPNAAEMVIEWEETQVRVPVELT